MSLLSSLVVVVIIYSISTTTVLAVDMKAVSSVGGILTRKMKAAIVPNFKNKFEIQEVDIPTPKADECLVKIAASGCCHTDLHAINGDWPVKAKMPLIPGHEGVGFVHQVGERVTQYKVGDRVGIAWLHSACGTCEYCLTGWETLCSKQQNTGYSVDGCFREYAISKESHTVKLPDNLPFDQAAPILCAGLTSYKGLKETEARPGEFVTIIGAAGGLGHLAIQYAKGMGLRPIAIDLGMGKKDICISQGAELYVDCSPDNPINILKSIDEYTQGGSHGVLCLATNPKAFELAINVCRRKGCIVCCGLPAGGFETPIFDVVLKRLTIRGSIVGTRQDMTEALDFCARGLVKAQLTTTSLDQINKVYSDMAEGTMTGRTVITFN